MPIRRPAAARDAAIGRSAPWPGAPDREKLRHIAARLTRIGFDNRRIIRRGEGAAQRIANQRSFLGPSSKLSVLQPGSSAAAHDFAVSERDRHALFQRQIPEFLELRIAQRERRTRMLHVGQRRAADVRSLGLRGFVDVVRKVAVFVHIERLRRAQPVVATRSRTTRIRQVEAGRRIDIPSLVRVRLSADRSGHSRVRDLHRELCHHRVTAHKLSQAPLTKLPAGCGANARCLERNRLPSYRLPNRQTFRNESFSSEFLAATSSQITQPDRQCTASLLQIAGSRKLENLPSKIRQELFQLRANRVGHFARADGGRVVAVGFQVVGDVLAFGDDVGHGLFQAVGGVDFAQVAQHQHAGEDQGGRVDLVLPLVLRGAAVRGFEHRAVGADVLARRDAQAADQAGAQIAEDVAVQVRQHEHVVQLGLLHELHAHVVDDAVLELDVRIFLGDLRAQCARNRPSEYFMMFALWTAVTFLRLVLAGVVEAHSARSARCRRR